MNPDIPALNEIDTEEHFIRVLGFLQPSSIPFHLIFPLIPFKKTMSSHDKENELRPELVLRYLFFESRKFGKNFSSILPVWFYFHAKARIRRARQCENFRRKKRDCKFCDWNFLFDCFKWWVWVPLPVVGEFIFSLIYMEPNCSNAK